MSEGSGQNYRCEASVRMDSDPHVRELSADRSRSGGGTEDRWLEVCPEIKEVCRASYLIALYVSW